MTPESATVDVSAPEATLARAPTRSLWSKVHTLQKFLLSKLQGRASHCPTRNTEEADNTDRDNLDEDTNIPDNKDTIIRKRDWRKWGGTKIVVSTHYVTQWQLW
jgi:hypothetical protein